MVTTLFCKNNKKNTSIYMKKLRNKVNETFINKIRNITNSIGVVINFKD